MFPGSIGYQELVIIGVVAVILFGGRLPEVARNLGQTYQQFRRGLSDLQSTFNVDDSDNQSTPSGLPDYSDIQDEYSEPIGPRFEPPEDEDDTTS